MKTEGTTRRPFRIGMPSKVAVVLAIPILLLTSCKLSDVTDPITQPLEDLFGLTSHEVATPKFEIVNGITIQIVVRIDDLAHGIPVTVHLRCAGGTELTDTINISTNDGSVSVGQATFHPGWPAGTDCLVSQDVVNGVDAVTSTLNWLDSNDVRATFNNV